MIAMFLTFRFGNDFDEAKIRKIADGARPKFQGMPGLRSKAVVAPATGGLSRSRRCSEPRYPLRVRDRSWVAVRDLQDLRSYPPDVKGWPTDSAAAAQGYIVKVCGRRPVPIDVRA
jgi:hypothetical protein